MTDRELDEIMELWWPKVLRMAMRGTDKKLQGFARSISKQGKASDWRPSDKQASFMRHLVHELSSAPEVNIALIE